MRLTEWYTPARLVEAARLAMGGIDLDPASTAEANEVVGAERFYDEADDGLTHPWSGRVWLSPPHARGAIRPFVDKLTDEYRSGAISQACVLTNNSTDSRWWQRLAASASALCLVRRRVRFWNTTKPSLAPLQGQTVLYLGRDVQAFRAAFDPAIGVALRMLHPCTPVTSVSLLQEDQRD